MVEHLVEKSLDQALRAGGAQGGRGEEGGILHLRRGVAPAGGVAIGGCCPNEDRVAVRAELQLAAVEIGTERGIERADAVQAPEREAFGRGGLEHPRGREGQGGGKYARGQCEIETPGIWRCHGTRRDSPNYQQKHDRCAQRSDECLPRRGLCPSFL